MSKYSCVGGFIGTPCINKNDREGIYCKDCQRIATEYFKQNPIKITLNK